MAKRQMETADERGWYSCGGWVCAECIAEAALKKVVSDAVSTDEVCDFCKGTPAADMDVLTEAFVNGLHTEYANADNEGVPYDSAEGGYHSATTWDTWALVHDHSDVFANDALLQPMVEAVGEQTWTNINWQLPRYNEQLASSWSNFCEQIQYKTRYVFWLRRDGQDEEEALGGEIPAGRILDQIGRHLLDLDLVRDLPAGTTLWRARPVTDKDLEAASSWGAEALGTAPRQYAVKPNRMSPAGIPMFYGAFDQATAVQEVTQGTPMRLAVGAFELSHACTVVDFTQLPPIPSMFDPEHGHQVRALTFLHQFVRQMATPVRPGHDHIDYIPTQVVAEYLMKAFNPGRPVHGIVYGSSLNRRRCVVLDLDSTCCVEQVDGWSSEHARLGLVPNSVAVLPAETS
ncbi:HEPN-associated N-terminal domain-containing protein [Kitasatospora sp. MBT66]|uniref:HEPN-associated N-terminal domain-containing protein n=1 Tax=Kitasatospora sp. MBT66 TaxID=1444769 RepID=UPI0009E6F6C0|nr:HEPN-associated N-terminal domain-containing protein [Kitasatospora sp. MBT66]